MIYEVRYKAMIRYALLVMFFDDDQLHKIQQQFIFHYLPKVYLNRHTPRAVVYGPVTMGGLGKMDLRIEQVVHAFKTVIGHICRNDHLDKSMCITLYYTQAVAGMDCPFFLMDIHQTCSIPSIVTCVMLLLNTSNWKYCFPSTGNLTLRS